jgi:hypothetical protein
MTFIETIPEEQASGVLAELYAEDRADDGDVWNGTRGSPTPRGAGRLNSLSSVPTLAPSSKASLPNTAMAPNAAPEARQKSVPADRMDGIVAARSVSIDSDSHRRTISVPELLDLRRVRLLRELHARGTIAAVADALPRPPAPDARRGHRRALDRRGRGEPGDLRGPPRRGRRAPVDAGAPRRRPRGRTAAVNRDDGEFTVVIAAPSA